MHGTFRRHVDCDGVITVRFQSHAPKPHRREWRTTLAALCAGCCLAALPSAQYFAAPIAKAPSFTRQKPLGRRFASALPSQQRDLTQERRLSGAQELSASHRNAVIRIVLPEPTPVTAAISPVDARAELTAASGPSVPTNDPPSAPIPDDGAVAPHLVDSEVPPVAPVGPNAPGEEALRPVDVAQISESDVRSLNVPELHEPGLAAGGEPNLSAKIAAMQVTALPPVRLRDSDRAALLAEAPTQMTLRIGGSALGKVDFRMSDTHTIDVRLGNLLDLLAGHYDGAEFARLRTSAAADAYVSFDQLRALGLNVHYDPAYDEVQITG